MGGKAAHEKGTAWEWTPDEARTVGRKGGARAHWPKYFFSTERYDMALYRQASKDAPVEKRFFSWYTLPERPKNLVRVTIKHAMARINIEIAGGYKAAQLRAELEKPTSGTIEQCPSGFGWS